MCCFWLKQGKERKLPNPRQLCVRDGTLGSSHCCHALLSLSFATSPHLLQWNGVWRAWRHIAGILEGAQNISPSALRTRRVSKHARQRNTAQTQLLEWHISKCTKWNRDCGLRRLTNRRALRYCTFSLSRGKRQLSQTAWLTYRSLSEGKGCVIQDGGWLGQALIAGRCVWKSSCGGCRWVTVGCGSVPKCVAHCWVMKRAPGGSCRVCVIKRLDRIQWAVLNAQLPFAWG